MFSIVVDVFQPIRSPLAPGILITGIVPTESSIFKSALHPLRLTFRTASGGTCKVIFKKGDDLRQDQLVGCFFFVFLKRRILYLSASCLDFLRVIILVPGNNSLLDKIQISLFSNALANTRK